MLIIRRFSFWWVSEYQKTQIRILDKGKCNFIPLDNIIEKIFRTSPTLK